MMMKYIYKRSKRYYILEHCSEYDVYEMLVELVTLIATYSTGLNEFMSNAIFGIEFRDLDCVIHFHKFRDASFAHSMVFCLHKIKYTDIGAAIG